MKYNKIKCLSIFLLLIVLFSSCNNNVEEEKVNLNSVNFIDKNITVNVGQQKALEINYAPSNADVADSDFKYECIPEDYLKIIKSDKSGCIVEAVKNGSGVVSVSSGNYSAYVQVDVEDPEFSSSPYITLPFTEIKMNTGDNKTVVSNIIGGNKDNFSKMTWSSTDTSVVNVQYSENTCVLTAKKSGVSVISCNAGGVLYAAEMLAIVSDNNNDFFYISTSDNVVNIKEGQSKEINLTLEGGQDSDYSSMNYVVSDGEDNISISGSGGKYTVYGRNKGEALIKFIHPKSKININVRVIVNSKDFEGGIKSDKDFIVLKENEREFINLNVEGIEGGEWSYQLSNNDTVNVSNSGNHFVIDAINEGNCILTVYNSMCSKGFDIQIIVEKKKISENYYIKTTQNIIKTEVGFSDYELDIQLLGGNESDKNGFLWTVSDSSIIDVTTNTGKVVYSRNASDINDYIDGKCYIKALKEGKAEIEITHPKANNKINVEVYVYKKGTFSKEFCNVKCDTFVSVINGDKTDFYLNFENVMPQNIDINVENNEIINALYKNGIIEIEGKNTGTTSFTVNADNFIHPVNVKVRVVNPGEYIKYIKIDIPYLELKEGMEQYVELKCNYSDEPIYEIQCSNPNICQAKIIDSFIYIKAVSKGEAVIYVNEKDSDILTEIYVYVLDSEIIDNPYHIECSSFLKTYINGEVPLDVKIKNAAEYKISYDYDTDYLRISEKNGKIYIKGIKEGSTQVKLKSNISYDEYIVNVYIYENSEEMNGYNFFYVKDQKIEVTKGNKKIIKLYSSENKIPSEVNINVNDSELMNVTQEGDLLIISCKQSGTAIITLKAEKYIKLEIPVLIKENDGKIYSDTFNIEPFIQGIINEKVKVNVILEGKYETLGSMLKWNIPSEFKYTMINNGLILETDKEGEYIISCEIEGEIRTSNIIIYKDQNVKEKSNFIKVPSNIFTINKNEIIEIIPSVISKNYREDDLYFTADSENIVEYEYKENKLYIKGQEEGKVIIKAAIKNCNLFNNCEITVYVKNNGNIYYNYIDGPKIVSTDNGSGGFNFNIYENSKISDNHNELSYECNRNDCEINLTDNYLRFYSDIKGYFIITIKKEGFKELKTLICNKIDLTKESVIFCDSDNIVLNVDEEREIEFYCSEENVQYSFSVKGDNVFSVVSSEKGKVKIKGITNGSAVLNCKTKNTEKEIQIYVINDISKINISVEPVILLKKGNYYTTSVHCNKTVNFECSDKGLILNVNGNNCTFYSDNKGLHVINVKCDGEERVILVYVYDEDENIKLFNIPQRNYYVNKGETFTIVPYIQNGNIQEINITDLSYDYAQVNNNEGILKIKALKEGMFNIICELNSQKLVLNIYINDNNISENENDLPVNFYMTTDTPYIKGKPEEKVNISINAISYTEEGFFDYENVIWTSSNPEYVKLDSYTRFCSVQASREGRYFIYAKSIQSSNVMVFTYDCSYDNYSDTVYLYTEKKNIRLDYNTKSYTFDVKLKNSTNKNTVITMSCDSNEYIKVSKAEGNNFITVTADYIKPGTTCITFSNNECENLYIYINTVSETINDIPYLTTVQNYNVIKPGQFQKIEVKLVNYEEMDSSNYRWRIVNGSNYITLIGKGAEVQVYGNSEGVAHIEVIHIPTQSKIELYVEVSRMIKNVKYITCEQSIVETDISSVFDFINLSIIGGKKDENYSFTYSCDNDDVLSVIMDGPVLYYRGLKEGECKVTVENQKAGCINKINIRFIVTNKENTMGIKLSDSALSLIKNGSCKTVTAEIFGIDNINYSNLEWYVYYQNGSRGDVISIIPSGNKCVIKPIEEGFARIRVCYLPKGFTASLGVYVDINGNFKFEKDNIILTEGDNTFLNINYPVWLDNPGDYISYESLSPDIAKCFGTGRVCCIEAVSKGSCIIRAVNSFDGSVCEIGVTVNEKGKDSNRLSVSKNTFVLNPRSPEQIIKGKVFGKELTEYDNENIKWEIISDTSGSITINPGQGSEIMLKLKPCTDLNDKDYGKVKSGEALIKVTHEKCPDSEQRIYVCINENQNFFTLDKYSLNMSVGGTAELSCNILNSKLSDFDNVTWTVTGFNTDKYGNRVEVARLLSGKGKTCNLYALNEGVCTVTAFYFGNTVQCEVNVVADRVMRINGPSSIKMFPDIRDDNYIDVSYILRPSQNIPVWTVENLDKPSGTTVISVEELNGEQKIRIRPNGIEGKCKVTGFAVGIGQVSINVDVKFEPELRLLEGDPNVVIEMEDGGNNERIVKFLSYPSMYTVDTKIGGKYADYVKAYVEKETIVNDCREGILRIKVLKEFPVNGCNVILQQYKDTGKTEVINSVNSKLKFNVSGAYKDSGFSLAYQRGRGSFINVSGSPAGEEYNIDENFKKTTTNGKYKLIYDSTENETVPKTINLADSEDHYFIIKSKHDNSFMSNINVQIDMENARYEWIDKEISSSEEKERIQGFMQKNKPVISGIEAKSDGSYVFNIKTGDTNTKYGLYWNQKEQGKSGNIVGNSNYKYSSRVKVRVPYFVIDGEEIPLYNFGKGLIKIENNNDIFSPKTSNYIKYKNNYYILNAVRNVDKKQGDLKYFPMKKRICGYGGLFWESYDVNRTESPELLTWNQLVSKIPYDLENIYSYKWDNGQLRISSQNNETGGSFIGTLYKTGINIDFTYDYYYDHYTNRYICICAYDCPTYSTERKYKAFYMTESNQPPEKPQSESGFYGEGGNNDDYYTPMLCGIYGTTFADNMYIDRKNVKDVIITKYETSGDNQFTDQWDNFMAPYDTCEIKQNYFNQYDINNDLKNIFNQNNFTVGYLEKNPELLCLEDSKNFSSYKHPFAQIKRKNCSIIYKDEYIDLEINKDMTFVSKNNDNKSRNLAAMFNSIIGSITNENDKLFFINCINKEYYYDNKTEPDFIIKNININLQWQNLSGKIINKTFPVSLNFYRNYNDYYIYDDKNKLIGENKNRINTNIVKYINYQ